ncbi:MAG: 3-phosphoshikimate 1-carboxyvinyltransferase [Wenzhouxiangellaceae bacterium]
MLEVTPCRAPLAGRLRPPGDKSISHRAAILGGLAHGTTRIEGFLCADDTLATLAAMRALGAEVTRDDEHVEITGGRLQAPADALDLGNSGTGIRLLAGALAGHPDLLGQRIELIGDESLSRRPMGRIIEPLSRMGARIDSRDGCAPLVLWPGRLDAIEYSLPVASAQVKSAVLLAGLFARGSTRVIEPAPSRDHTERLLPAFGVSPDNDGRSIGVSGRVPGGAALRAADIRVPGDLSSAAFSLAAALLVPGSRVTIGPVGLNPTRDGFLRIVERMAPGAVRVEQSPSGSGEEPVGELEVCAPDGLQGFEIPHQWVPLAIDEFPVVMALAAVARGTTVIQGAAELRVKESDRLAAMSEELEKLGVKVEQKPDGAIVHGGKVTGGRVDARGDHRIAMSLAVLALVAEGPVIIDGAHWIRTSYPAFVEQMQALGAPIRWKQS